MTSKYWSEFEWVKKLRRKFGLPVIMSGTATEWRQYREESQKISPKIHWFTETGIDKIQAFFRWPLERLIDLRYALKNRFCSKFYLIKTELNPWQYHEIDDRILYGIFHTLVDYVEIERAWMMVVFENDETIDARKKYGYKWYEMNYWTAWFFERRHPQAGVDHLKWMMSSVQDDAWYGNNADSIAHAKETGEYGKPLPCAQAAEEILKLYTWWKEERPLRLDPYDAAGASDFWHKEDENECMCFLEMLDKPREDNKEYFEALDRASDIEQKYEKEDDEMLERLVKIRKHLWT